jgi:hypothetical protein
MTPEAKVKDKVKKLCKKLGAYYVMPVGTGYGNVGVPDFIVCYSGKFFGIECKAGKGKTTALQDKNLNDITTSGGAALVVNEDNLPHLEQYMNHYILTGEKLWTSNPTMVEV